MLLMVSSLFLFGCGIEENNDSNKNNTTYTNKFECIREDKLTKDQIYYATKEEPLNGEILDYDMDKQKTYYENNCNEIDQKTYKSCKVILDNKKIIITSEIDLNSEVAKEYLATVSLNDVKENYADTPYTCK